MSEHDPRPDGPADMARVCPECGELVPFVEWPGEESCQSCGSVLFVNASGQTAHTPLEDFPDG